MEKYFNYHAKIINKIRNDELVGYKIVKSYHGASPAMLLFFSDTSCFFIRSHRFDFYFNLFDNLETKLDNNNVKIKVIQGSRLKTNNYLIMKNGCNVLIEASCDPIEVADVLCGEKLDAILLTHSHFDHVLTLNDLLVAYPNAKLVCHKKALAELKNPTQRFIKPMIKHKNVMQIDGDCTFSIGELNFETLEVLGHTKDGVVYVLGDKMFTGDTVMKGSVGRFDMPGGDEEELNLSIKKIFSFNKNIDYFQLPGHYEGISRSENEKLLKDMWWL